jgi:hypothetical protein
MAAFKLLTKKDPNTLVIVDRLVSREILDLIPNEIKIARKLPGCADLAQEEIYWWAYQALNKGKHVIRLKIGDPFVFGRGGEEVLKFRHFGVEAKVVPVRILAHSSTTRWHDSSHIQMLMVGRFGCLFRASFGDDPCDSPRICQSGGNVHWIRS